MHDELWIEHASSPHDIPGKELGLTPMHIKTKPHSVQTVSSITEPQILPPKPDPANTVHQAEATSANHPLLERSPNAESGDFVVLSRFTAAKMADEAKQAFRQRPHRVDSAPGFVRMEVLSPCDCPNEFWLFTYWKDEPSYRAWHHSHLYKESHEGIPKGLRLVPKSVSIRLFEHVAS